MTNSGALEKRGTSTVLRISIVYTTHSREYHRHDTTASLRHLATQLVDAVREEPLEQVDHLEWAHPCEVLRLGMNYA